MVAFIIIKWVLPLFQAVINRAQVETSIYGNAKDMIDYMSAQLSSLQVRYDALQKQAVKLESELMRERERCRRLQAQLEKFRRDADES